jgi:hypothetical protein
VHDVSLLCTYGKTEFSASCRKLVYALSHLLLCAGVYGTVIRKQQVADDGVADFSSCIMVSLVEQFSIGSVTNLDTGVILEKSVRPSTSLKRSRRIV